jgi:hypothetical protein
MMRSVKGLKGGLQDVADDLGVRSRHLHYLILSYPPLLFFDVCRSCGLVLHIKPDPIHCSLPLPSSKCENSTSTINSTMQSSVVNFTDWARRSR